MSFTFNGISTDSMNLRVEKFPPRVIPNRKITEYEILGRNGNLITDYNSYTNVIQPYEVYVRESSVGFQDSVTAIIAWLLSVKGYKELRDSYDPSIYREARVANAAEFVNSLNKLGRATIEFDCKPQRWPITQPTYQGEIGDTFSFTLPANQQAGYPLMVIETIDASCSFSIEDSNGLRIVIPNRGTSIARIEVDWENQTVLNKFNDSVPSQSSIYGEWDTIGAGGFIRTTLDTATAPTVTVYPRGFYL